MTVKNIEFNGVWLFFLIGNILLFGVGHNISIVFVVFCSVMLRTSAHRHQWRYNGIYPEKGRWSRSCLVCGREDTMRVNVVHTKPKWVKQKKEES